MSTLAAPPACPCCGAPVDPLDVHVDPASGFVAHRGQVVKLQRLEFAFFTTLLRSYPAALSKSQIYDRIYGEWHDCDQPQQKIVDVLACKARAALDSLGLVITTEWGFGYGLSLASPEAAPNVREEALRLRGRRPKRAPDDEIVRSLVKEGYSLGAIAQRLGTSYAATERAMRRLGLFRVPKGAA